MSNVRFIGCLHLGHKWMTKHRGFDNEFEHDEYLIDSWNSIVHKKDLTYIIGDVTMEKSNNYYQLDRLNGRKIVVLGNHDLWKDVPKLLNYVDGVAGMIDYKGFCLTHCPIHPNELPRYKGNIHAHIYENKLIEVMAESSWKDPGSLLVPTLHKYYCVDAKLIDFKPKTIEELLNEKI
jgi:calcineurin-like phosphoesterase family protein